MDYESRYKMQILTKEEMYRADRYTIEEIGISGYALMECAGQAMAMEIMKYINLETDRNYMQNKKRKPRVLVISGYGNNGGDGAVIARRLLGAGIKTQLWFCESEDKIKNEALKALNAYKKSGYQFDSYTQEKYCELQEAIKNADVIVDAIFGIGVSGIPQKPYSSIIEEINQSSATVFSVDIPSGIGADDADASCKVNADTTLTVQFPKLSAYLYPAAINYGKLKIIDIGIISPDNKIENKRILWTQEEYEKNQIISKKDEHKGKNGRLLIVGGSEKMIGAPVMTAMASARSGAGLITMGIPKSNRTVASSWILEAMYTDCKEENGVLTDVEISEDVDFIAAGMGLGRDLKTLNIIEKILDSDKAVLIDGDGLYFLREVKDKLRQRTAVTILTPHMGEMAALCKEDADYIRKNRFKVSKEFALEHNVYLVLKGPNTIVSCPDGTQYINTSGNQSMAKGGSGDVLSGIIAGSMASSIKKEAIYMEAKNSNDDTANCKHDKSQLAVLENPVSIGKVIINAVYVHGKAADELLEQGREYRNILPTDLINKL